ncbi:putative pci domain-containing protein [Rosellinia necatrix]|uniref:Putative pci domain-containing protein n=1 Tax=Rosellinia necatrix TaxID=77044 RepID=A0A1S7UJD7_ROSNE|nr:putative pci domain-containing protein [Rosellinia necatrix]
MFADQIALLALSSLTLVSAQANSNSTFKIDPSTVEPLQQSMWCGAQQDSCNTLCGTAIVNNCTPETLDFMCECTGGNVPDMNLYLNTIPWFVCDKLQTDCTVAHEGDAAGQKNCTATYKDNCGTENVQDHKGEGAASATTSASTSAGPEPTTSTTPETTSSSAGAAAATAHIQHIGNGAAAVALGLLAYAL